MEESKYISAVSQPLIKDTVMCNQDLPHPRQSELGNESIYLFLPFYTCWPRHPSSDDHSLPSIVAALILKVLQYTE